MFQVGKAEQLESTEIQVLVGKGAQADWAVPGELHTLRFLVSILTILKGGAKRLSISLHGELRWENNSTSLDRESSYNSHRSTVSTFPVSHNYEVNTKLPHEWRWSTRSVLKWQPDQLFKTRSSDWQIIVQIQYGIQPVCASVVVVTATALAVLL
jgi:hypothetical protein